MYTTYYNKTYLTCGAWHPQRVGVFFTTRYDGCLDCWDLVYRQNSPVLTVQVSDYPLHTMKPVPGDGQYIAVGSVDGCTTLLELSPHLSLVGHNNPGPAAKKESDTIGKMFDNECQRDKNLLTRARERQRQKEPKAQPGDAKDMGTVPQDQLDDLTRNFLDDIAKHEKEDKDRQEEQQREWQNLIDRIDGGADEPDDDVAY